MSLESNLCGDKPKVSDKAYIHQSAILIGNVVVGDKVYIGPRAVIRADEIGPDGFVEPIIIGERSNVQDGVIIHALGGTGVIIGNDSSIAHNSVIHGPCEIGPGCFVGFCSVIFRAVLGEGVIVMHKALVDGVTIPDNMFVPSMRAICSQCDAGSLSPATNEMRAFTGKVSLTNNFLVEGMRDKFRYF